MDFTLPAIAAAISFAVSALSGLVIVPILKKFKFGQTASEYMSEHKNKSGTPTMGGIMFILSSIIGFSFGLYQLWSQKIIVLDGVGQVNFRAACAGLAVAVCFGFVGFLDDFIKIRLKRNEGLTEFQKIFWQVLVIAAYFGTNYYTGERRTWINIPLYGNLELGFWYYPIMLCVVLYIVNAVNFTDGLDGLCGSVTLVYMSAFLIITSAAGFDELPILCAAVAGGCLGFLLWNFNPAKVFMGDCGSLFLGGAVCVVGIASKQEVAMIVAAGVYIFEALTVIIQRAYYKLTGGKRIFKKTPYHHALQLSGYKEPFISVAFSAFGVLCGGLAIFLSIRFL